MYIDNIDWLAFSGHCPRQNSLKYGFQDTAGGTTLFEHLYNVIEMRTGTTIAQMQTTPRSEFVDRNLCILKIANEQLYAPNLFDWVNDLLYNLAFHVHSINRIDVCRDFQRLKNVGSPESLIMGLQCGEYYIRHPRTTYINGSDLSKVTAMHRTKHGGLVLYNDYQFVGEPGGCTPQTLRLGKRDSRVCTYMYNKSDELKRKADKRYIRAIWAKNRMRGDVWRLEFSLKGKFWDADLWQQIQAQGLTPFIDSLVLEYFAIFARTDEPTEMRRTRPLTLYDSMSADDVGDVKRLVRRPTATKSDRRDRLLLCRLAEVAAGDYDSDGIIEQLADTLGYEFAKWCHLLPYWQQVKRRKAL